MLTTTARLSPRRLTGFRLTLIDAISRQVQLQQPQNTDADADSDSDLDSDSGGDPSHSPSTTHCRCSDMSLWPICSSINLQSTFISQRPERASANVSIHTLPGRAKRDCASSSASANLSQVVLEQKVLGNA